MNTQKTDVNFKIQNLVQEYEVIGQGEMPTSPMQIGEWWVIPAELYEGKIPKEVQQKMFTLINSGVEIEGFLIAEDMRVIEEKKKQKEKIKKAKDEALKVTGGLALAALALPVITLGLGMAAFLSMLWAFDPLLICVTKGEQKWVCLGEWFD